MCDWVNGHSTGRPFVYLNLCFWWSLHEAVLIESSVHTVMFLFAFLTACAQSSSHRQQLQWQQQSQHFIDLVRLHLNRVAQDLFSPAVWGASSIPGTLIPSLIGEKVLCLTIQALRSTYTVERVTSLLYTAVTLQQRQFLIGCVAMWSTRGDVKCSHGKNVAAGVAA